MTKADLAVRAGVSRSTVTTALSALARDGLVEDGWVDAHTGGRPSTQVQLVAGQRLVAVAFGAADVRIALTDGRLEQLGTRTVRRPRPGGVVEAGPVHEAVTGLLADHGVRRPDAIGIVPPVWPDSGAELVALLGDRLAEQVGVTPVVAGPAAALALGERQAGRARGCADLLVLRLGATVTSALVSEGRLAPGASRRAGEIGHVRVDPAGTPCHCGRTGCLDAVASAVAVLRRAEEAARAGASSLLAERMAARPLAIEDLAAAVAAGEPEAVRIAREAGRWAGEAVAAMVALADPEVVVLGGILTVLGPDLVDEVDRAARAALPADAAERLEVGVGELGDRAALIGAAQVASDDLIARATAPAPVPTTPRRRRPTTRRTPRYF